MLLNAECVTFLIIQYLCYYQKILSSEIVVNIVFTVFLLDELIIIVAV